MYCLDICSDHKNISHFSIKTLKAYLISRRLELWVLRYWLFIQPNVLRGVNSLGTKFRVANKTTMIFNSWGFVLVVEDTGHRWINIISECTTKNNNIGVVIETVVRSTVVLSKERQRRKTEVYSTESFGKWRSKIWDVFIALLEFTLLENRDTY